MTIKLIALDMDGTVLTPAHEITDAVHTAITEAKQRGVKVVLTSGRPYIGMQKYIQQLGLNENEQYCISYNGALVQSAFDGSCLAETTLGYSDYLRFEQLARELGVHFQALDKSHLYTPNQNISRFTVHETEVTSIPLRYRAIEQMDQSLRFPKLMMVDEPEKLDQAIASLPPELYQDYTLVKSSNHYLEILDRTANKGAAVSKLAGMLNITAEEIMAVGDHENDISMISWAGVGVAMGNAIEKVKQQANYQTASNRENGVAEAIQRFVLND
jgi:Cof subfamily protein (haloacid dehalogenase superfamily)